MWPTYAKGNFGRRERTRGKPWGTSRERGFISDFENAEAMRDCLISYLVKLGLDAGYGNTGALLPHLYAVLD